MARICKVCGKGPRVDNLVSHANNKVKRWVYPNVHRVRFVLTNSSNNKVMQGSVCAKCMKAGKIKKVI